MLREDVSRGVSPTLLMLDYDGTIAPIVSNFDEAYADANMLALLERLSQNPYCQVAIVSGRSVEQLLTYLDGLIGLNILLVGLHGGEMYDMLSQDYIEEPPFAYQTSIMGLRNLLIRQNIHLLPGIRLEDKGHTLVVHYRQASQENADKALMALGKAIDSLGLGMEFTTRPAKKALEALPRGFSKGHAVLNLISMTAIRMRQTPSLIYIGDDVTDFDAFRVVNDHHGQSIFVGPALPENAPPVYLTIPTVAGVYDYLVNAFLSAAA